MVEFRLYYDDNGNVLCYTCDKPEGNYIVVDRLTYAECRFDIKVLDSKIIKSNEGAIITKLVPSLSGTRCTKEDVAIIVRDGYSGDTILWNTKQYEYRYN